MPPPTLTDAMCAAEPTKTFSEFPAEEETGERETGGEEGGDGGGDSSSSEGGGDSSSSSDAGGGGVSGRRAEGGGGCPGGGGGLGGGGLGDFGGFGGGTGELILQSSELELRIQCGESEIFHTESMERVDYRDSGNTCLSITFSLKFLCRMYRLQSVSCNQSCRCRLYYLPSCVRELK